MTAPANNDAALAERARRIKTHYDLPMGRHPERDKDKALREFAAALLVAQQERDHWKFDHQEASKELLARAVRAEATITRLRDAIEWNINDLCSILVAGSPAWRVVVSLRAALAQDAEQEKPYVKPADDPHTLVADALMRKPSDAEQESA